MKTRALLSAAASLAALLSLYLESPAAPPVIDLDTSTSGLSRRSDVVVGENTDFYNFYLLGPSVTDPDSATLSEVVVTLLNSPDGASEYLYISFPPGSITVDAYNPSTGVLHLTGVDTLANYSAALGDITYRNQSLNPTGGPRYIEVKGYDGAEWSKSAICRQMVWTKPSSADQTVLFEDDFTGGTFDTSKWQIFAGVSPTVSGGRATLTNSSIRPINAFSGAPLYIEFGDVDWVSFTNNSSAGFGVASVTGSPSRGYSTDRSTSTGFGDFVSTTSYYGSSVLQGGRPGDGFVGYREITDSDGTVAFLLTGETTYLFDIYSGGSAGFGIRGHIGTYKPEIAVSTDAVVTLDRVRISELTPTSPFIPTWKTFPTGATPNSRSFGPTGVTINLNHSSSTVQTVSVSRIDIAPPGYPTLASPFFWDISGLSGVTFSATVDFTFSPTALTGVGIPLNDLILVKSDDGGSTWSTVAGATLDGPNGTASASGVTYFSLWAVAPAAPPSAASGWSLYE